MARAVDPRRRWTAHRFPAAARGRAATGAAARRARPLPRRSGTADRRRRATAAPRPRATSCRPCGCRRIARRSKAGRSRGGRCRNRRGRSPRRSPRPRRTRRELSPPAAASHAGSIAIRAARWAPAEWPIRNSRSGLPPRSAMCACTQATARADVAELVVPVHRPDQPVADDRGADPLLTRGSGRCCGRCRRRRSSGCDRPTPSRRRAGRPRWGSRGRRAGRDRAAAWDRRARSRS